MILSNSKFFKIYQIILDKIKVDFSENIFYAKV